MIFYMLLIFVLGQQNSINAQGPSWKKFDVRKEDLQRLADLKYYLCGLTPTYKMEKNRWRGVGWFCVSGANCSGREPKYAIAPDTKPLLLCNSLRYNEGREYCCFTGKIKPPFKFMNGPSPDWDLYLFTGTTSKTQDMAEMEEHRRALFYTFMTKDSPEESILNEYEICSVLPIGRDKGRTTWTPYICVSGAQCEGYSHENVYVDIQFPFGDRFCARSLSHSEDRPVCCHMSTAIPINNKKQYSWKFIEFLDTQKYAPGFRSRFMCEQYNKLVCDGKKDRCAQKMLFRFYYTLPGEFPHHALVGISLPRRQTYHCQGSIISRLFVLTSYDCRERDRTLTNIVLVGTFKFDQDEEPPINEQYSYVKNLISAPDKHWFLLLRLWRPLILNAFVKPACIDWFSYDKNLSSKEFDFGQGWIVSYSPLHAQGNFTTNVTRLIFTLNSTKTLKPKDREIVCKARLPALKNYTGKFADLNNHVCLLGSAVYSPLLDQMHVDRSQLHGHHLGFLSHGASLSVFERYCQWKVYGVYVQNEKYLTVPPLMIETVPHALAWIEEIVWREEFDWLFMNMTWPDCADWENSKVIPRRKGGRPNEAEHQFNFYSGDYFYLKPQHDEFFNGLPS